MAKRLDANQVLKQVFVGATNSLRTTATFDGNLAVQTTPNRFPILDYSQHIPTSSIKILEMNPLRNFLFIQNSSNKKIWLDFNQDAAAGFPSMQLNSNQILFMESSSITIDSIYAIAEENNSPLIIKEG